MRAVVILESAEGATPADRHLQLCGSLLHGSADPALGRVLEDHVALPIERPQVDGIPPLVMAVPSPGPAPRDRLPLERAVALAGADDEAEPGTVRLGLPNHAGKQRVQGPEIGLVIAKRIRVPLAEHGNLIAPAIVLFGNVGVDVAGPVEWAVGCLVRRGPSDDRDRVLCDRSWDDAEKRDKEQTELERAQDWTHGETAEDSV